MGRSFESLRICFGRGESVANLKGGEGVYIEAPQKLAVVDRLCACRDFQHSVGTFDQLFFQLVERVLSETIWDL